ncbi:uncharacterized protein AB675_4015 [Cyphellophora attinorum]|uniref:Uncharacterized protein n=1 Tax=Cyphellophora attinorum TaxID=1664694 RepID=A0A0N1H692_9EURO|nr:uncharacterized protein AB675_4015 [Phialophora attinorum]KPI37605.1 hypothetical protein AB675_4015 [Phialophora attinorum]
MATETAKRSRRACSDPVGNGVSQGDARDGNGCTVCNNGNNYGFGKSTCGRCGRCHGCGSTNTGIGPVQAVYFGGKKAVRKIGQVFGGGKDGAEAEKTAALPTTAQSDEQGSGQA